MRYGLIGRKLKHSFSGELHRALAGYEYGLFELEPEEIAHFIRSPGFGGLNVTMPYKITVYELCDSLAPSAKRTGCVNTITYGANGMITGHNTDYDGFLYMMDRANIRMEGRKVLILGSGGAARSASAAAASRGAAWVRTVSRGGVYHYGNLSLNRESEIIINATPAGMYPDNGTRPVNLEDFPFCVGVADLVYTPLRTRLVRQAESLGIPRCGGLPMLAAQAKYAAELFLGKTLPEERIRIAASKVQRMAENIVLVGMPGCGKTSVGRTLAALTGRQFWDSDEAVESAAGKTIERIFAQDGEAAFREMERAALMDASKHGGRVIATGGGSVLDKLSASELKQNGRVYHIERDILSLAVKGRPLSTDLSSLYAERAPVYQAVADGVVLNNQSIELAARAIKELYDEYIDSQWA